MRSRSSQCEMMIWSSKEFNEELCVIHIVYQKNVYYTLYTIQCIDLLNLMDTVHWTLKSKGKKQLNFNQTISLRFRIKHCFS